jgi:hypothetical protein
MPMNQAQLEKGTMNKALKYGIDPYFLLILSVHF